MSPRLGGRCPDCEGDGEVYVGSSVPDDEGYEPCSPCGGSGRLPTLEELREIRRGFEEAQADCAVAELWTQQWKKRAEGLMKERGQVMTDDLGKLALRELLEEMQRHPRDDARVADLAESYRMAVEDSEFDRECECRECDYCRDLAAMGEP